MQYSSITNTHETFYVRNIVKLAKENSRQIKKEIIENAINGFRVVVYYSMEDERIHVDTITQGTLMCDDEIVINYFEGSAIDNDEFDKDEFILFDDIIDYDIFNDEIEKKGVEYTIDILKRVDGKQKYFATYYCEEDAELAVSMLRKCGWDKSRMEYINQKIRSRKNAR